MRILAVANQKGGCGKTTTVINLAASLAYLGKRTLIIDLDPQGHASIGLGLKPDGFSTTIYDVLTDSTTRIEDTILPYRKNIDIAPSNITLSTLDRKIGQTDKKEELLINAIFSMDDSYDYILIDTPPHVGLHTLNALRACREVIIPIGSSYLGLHGLGKLLETIILINERLNHHIRIKALSTMVDKRTKVSVDVLQEIRKIFHDNTFTTEINFNVKLKEAIGYGLPLVEYDKNSAGALDYLNLAKEIIQEEQTIEVQQLMHTLRSINEKSRVHETFAPKFVEGGISFSIKAENAQSVRIAGDFNNWHPSDEFEFLRDESGIWHKSFSLNSGLYQYKLIIDGKWITDPHNPIKVQSPFGGSNSVLVVK